MLNREVAFQGKAHWNSLKNIDKYGKWSIKLYFNEPSLETFRELQATKGTLTRLQKDDDGYYATFGRYQEKTYRGNKRIFNAPAVLNKDNTLFEGYVGHGSDVTVSCELYPYNIPNPGGAPTGKKGWAYRLASVRVDNLVPYNAIAHATEDEFKQVRGLVNVPPQEAY